MDIFKDTTQSGANWLQERTKGIGGSDIGCIMGTNKYKDIYTLKIKTCQVKSKKSNFLVIYKLK